MTDNGKPYEWRLLCGDRKVGDWTEVMRLEGGWLYCRTYKAVTGEPAMAMQFVPESRPVEITGRRFSGGIGPWDE